MFAINYPVQVEMHPVARTLRFCKHCQRETTHEIRNRSGKLEKNCLPCAERIRMYELDRD